MSNDKKYYLKYLKYRNKYLSLAGAANSSKSISQDDRSNWVEQYVCKLSKHFIISGLVS